jgi:hypothetical protein
MPCEEASFAKAAGEVERSCMHISVCLFLLGGLWGVLVGIQTWIFDLPAMLVQPSLPIH